MDVKARRKRLISSPTRNSYTSCHSRYKSHGGPEGANAMFADHLVKKKGVCTQRYGAHENDNLKLADSRTLFSLLFGHFQLTIRSNDLSIVTLPCHYLGGQCRQHSEGLRGERLQCTSVLPTIPFSFTPSESTQLIRARSPYLPSPDDILRLHTPHSSTSSPI